MSWFIIINPKAGNGQIETKIPVLKSLLDNANIKYTFVFTKYRLHAKELAIEAINKGHRKLMAIGGDGTNHEVVNGIMTQKLVISTDILFFSLPNGTGNDWGKHHNLTKSWEDRIQLMKNPTIKLQDIGTAHYYNNGKEEFRYFNSCAGIAYDAFVVKSLEEKGRKTNALAYLISVFMLLFKYKLNQVEINFNNITINSPVYTVNLGICKYTGGGMSLTPHAISDDGLLALTIAKKLSKFDVLFNTYRFYNESILDHKKIDGYQTKRINIKSTNSDPLYIELDGEFVGEGPIEIRIIDKALKFVSNIP